MERTPVKSSNVAGIGYDPETKLLEVEYNSGAIYHYHDVEPALHLGLSHAGSPGGYISDRIKGKHKCTKVDSP